MNNCIVSCFQFIFLCGLENLFSDQAAKRYGELQETEFYFQHAAGRIISGQYRVEIYTRYWKLRGSAVSEIRCAGLVFGTLL